MQDLWSRMAYFSLFFLILLLQGCMNAAVSGAQVVYNRHALQRNLHDQYVTMRVYKALKVDDDRFNGTNISISTYNNEVLLAGQVQNAQQREEAFRIAKEIPHVSQVYNLITVASPSSTLTKLSDAWVTAKIKAQLIASNDVDATQIKVTTENGTVYLMGIVEPNEAQAAVDIASTTEGVERVVKAFSYIRISKN